MKVLESTTTLVSASLCQQDKVPYNEVKLHATDLFLERRCIHLSFIYRRPQDTKGLISSLSALVKLCPIIAGRVSLRKSADGKPAPIIDCDNSGVAFTEQYISAEVDDFTPETFRMENCAPTPDLPIYMAGIDMDRALAGEEALMQVKVTQLRDGGSIFSAAFAHIAVDGRSVAMLCSAWVALYNGADVAEVPSPPVDRTLLTAPERFQSCEPKFENKALGTCYDSLLRQMKHVYAEATSGSAWKNLKEKATLLKQRRANQQAFPGKTLNREVMYIPHSDVTKFKAKVHAAVKATQPFGQAPMITANDALSALVWHVTALLRKHPLPGQQEELPHGTLGFAFDVRSPGDGVPNDYVGNAALNFWLPGGLTTYTQQQKLLPKMPKIPALPRASSALKRLPSLSLRKKSLPLSEPESPTSPGGLISTRVGSESDASSSAASESSGSESGSPLARSVSARSALMSSSGSDSEGSLSRTNSGDSLPRTTSAPATSSSAKSTASSTVSSASSRSSSSSSSSSYDSDEDFDALASTSARLRTTIATLRDPKAVWQMAQVQAEMAKQTEKERTRRRAVCVADVECYTGTWTGFSTAAFDFGTGAPHAANGFTSPFNPWWFNFVEDPMGGLQISAYVPSSAAKPLREHPLWRKCLPNARFL